jgi:hypothetical protein
MESRKFNCPNCMGSDTLMELVGEADKVSGKITKEQVLSFEVQTAYTNIKRAIGDKATVAIIYRDICLGCGVKYIKQIDFQETTVQASTQQPKLFYPGQTPLPKRIN